MAEIFTRYEMKQWLKTEDTFQDDALIDALITTCTEYAELYTNIKFVKREFIYNYAGYLNNKYEKYPYINIFKHHITTINKVESIIDSTATIIADNTYMLKKVSNYGRVIFTTTPDCDTAEPYPYYIYFNCGLVDSIDLLPEVIKTAIKFHVAYKYENRGDVLSEGSLNMPLETRLLLNKYRVQYIM